MSDLNYPYALPNMTSGLDPLTYLFSYGNTSTGGYFVIMGLLALLMIIFVSTLRRGYGTSKSLFAGLFITSVSGILLNLAGLVSVDWVIFFCIAAGASGLWAYVSGD